MIERLSATEYRNMLASNTKSKRSKFGNKNTWRCGKCNAACETRPKDGEICLNCEGKDFIRFDSRGEGRYWDSLIQLQLTGVVSKVERQVKYPIMQNGICVATLVADFRFFDNATGNFRTVDFKGGKATQTKDFKLKKKCVEAQYGISVEIATRPLL